MDQNFFVTPFGLTGDQTAIPTAVQSNGMVSFSQGWTADYQRDQTSDPLAKPIDRATMNYLFYVITQAIAQYQQHGMPEWITPANNGGSPYSYAKFSVVRYSSTSPGTTFETYVSAVDGNTSVPGADTNWQPISSIVATAAQATAGTDNRNPITSLTLAQQTALRALLAGSTTQVFNVAQAVAGSQAPQVQQVAGPVGAARNLSAIQVAVASTLTVTADEIVVETALGGVRYCLANFNKTINLATTGAGGMDTGTAPVSGFVGIYAISNPVTGAAALLAVNATAAKVPEVYSGSNMPSGYTASALVSVWPTNSSGQLIVASQCGRSLNFASTGVLSTSGVSGTPTSFSLSVIVPKNAKYARGALSLTNSAGAISSFTLFDQTQIGASSTFVANNSANSGGASNQFPDFPILTAQTWWWVSAASAGTLSALNVSLSGFTF